MLEVLQHVHTYTWALQGDDARTFAFEVAQAACRNLISTEVVPGEGVYGRIWKITSSGLKLLEDNAHRIAKEELAHYRAKPLDWGAV
jgi:hypothetical protein